jgi:preprotein translocase subunit YajC
MNTLTILLQAAQGGFDMTIIFLMMGIFLVVQFVIIGPRQKKKEKEQLAFIENLSVGSKMVTASGIHGKFLRIEDNTLILEIDNGVKIKIEKNYINFDLTKAINNSTEVKK